jgi:hypothetical protein
MFFLVSVLMTLAPDFPRLSLDDSKARLLAFGYVSEAFAEAVLDGVDVESFADAALCAAFRELVAVHGEARSALIAEALVERVKAGEFSSLPRH